MITCTQLSKSLVYVDGDHMSSCGVEKFADIFLSASSFAIYLKHRTEIFVKCYMHMKSFCLEVTVIFQYFLYQSSFLGIISSTKEIYKLEILYRLPQCAVVPFNLYITDNYKCHLVYEICMVCISITAVILQGLFHQVISDCVTVKIFIVPQTQK